MKLSCSLPAILAAFCAAAQTLNAAAPTDGLVGYWSFDASSLAETSGFKPAGTHDGVAVGSVAFSSGPAGQALDLTANNTAVKISNSNVTDPGYQDTFDALLYNSAEGFTVTAWVKGLPGTWNCWVSKYGEGSSGYQVRRYSGNNVGTFTLRSSDGDDDPYNPAGISFNDGSWHHVAGVYDPTADLRLLYVDGIEDVIIYDGNLDPTSAPGQSLVFGARNDDAASGVLTGFSSVALDEVRLYRRALSADEVAGMYTPGIQVVPDSLVAYTPRADTNEVQMTVPDSLLASGAIDVVVTSQHPTVAVPVGAVNGSLTIHFAQGGETTKSFFIHAVSEGTTRFTYTSSQTWVNGETTVNVWADLSKSGTTVFLDTFNVSANSTSLNFEMNQRQSGSAAPVGYANLAVNLVGNPYDPKWFQVGAADAQGWLRLAGEGTANAFPGGSPSVLPKHNFIESKHFQVEYDILGYTDPAAGGWAGVKILDSTGTPQFLNGGDGLGFMFSGDGSGLVFDGQTQFATFAAGTFDPAAVNHISLEVVTGGWDGSRLGKTTVALSLNGQWLRTFTVNHHYKGNYISMYYALPSVGHPNVCTFDNLKLVIAPSAYANVTSVTTGVGVTSAPVTVYVPETALAVGDIDVLVTSADPTVAVPAGGSDGTLTLHFAKGGASSQTFSALGKAPGATTFTLSSPHVTTAGNISVSVGFLARSVVANPSFEDSYTPAWAPPGYLFMNRWTPNTESTGFNGTYGTQTILDFADNGRLPDRNLVAFIENNGSFEQNLAGLAVGAQHWVQFRYNVSANSSSGLPVGHHNLVLSFNGKPIDAIANAAPVEAAGGNSQPWHFRNVAFVPDASSGALKFEHSVADTDNAPATVLIDAISVIMRGTEEVVIENPSFEASDKPATSPYNFETDVRISGWTVAPPNGWGANASGDSFYDNGRNPDQDLVLFVQGAGKSVSQTVVGLVPATAYELSFAYNARSTGARPQLRVTMGNLDLMSATVAPVGGTKPFYRTNLTFTATASTMTLKFANASTASTGALLLDDVHLVSPRPSVTLTLQLAGNQVRLSWPSSATGWNPVRAEQVLGPYHDAGLVVTTVGNEHVALDTMSGAAKFYRLLKH